MQNLVTIPWGFFFPYARNRLHFWGSCNKDTMSKATQRLCNNVNYRKHRVT